MREIQPWLQITDEETGEAWDISGCPFSHLDPVAMEYVRWYGYWQRGLLPVPGGVLDQAQLFLEVMEYLDTLVNRKDARDADECRTRLDSQIPRSSLPSREAGRAGHRAIH
jgi:hypothetical protein